MAHTYTNLLTHIIFSTKDRAPLFDAELKPKLFGYMGGIVREMKGTALIINGTRDHVHLLVGLPPTLALSEGMRVLKTNRQNGFMKSGIPDKHSAGNPVTALSASASRMSWQSQNTLPIRKNTIKGCLSRKSLCLF